MEKMAISILEMSKTLGISRVKAYELANRKDFPVVQLGGRKLIPVDALKRWVDAQAEGRMNA